MPTFSESGNKLTWQELPIIPTPSQKVLEIYERGLILGNNPHAFSKIVEMAKARGGSGSQQ